MVIKCKDGTEFKLRGPNPLMKFQGTWSQEYVLHNEFGHTLTLPDTQETPPEPEKKEELKIVSSLPEEHAEHNPDKVQVWCLPASYKEYHDKLYGEKHTKIQYGQKFILEALLMDLADMHIKLWVNTKAVTLGSVLYPRIPDRRWWRVEHIQKQDDGYIVIGSLSDYQPKFAD